MRELLGDPKGAGIEIDLIPLEEIRYQGFIDAAGGGGADSMTCAVAHQGERGRVFVDQLVAIDPPFDTEAAVERCAMALKSYGITSAQADKYAGLWPAQSFHRHGISLESCPLSKSELYREVAPLFVSGLVSLIDDDRLVVELRGLERTPKSGGRGDAIDHAPGRGSHDDRINACAGALFMASRAPFSTVQGANTVQQTRCDYEPLTRDEDRARDREQSDPRPSYARPILYLD